MALKADPMDDERFDGMYLQVAQTIGGIDPLLDSFFGFLRRKTDFFAGAADPAKARETVLAAFEKNKERSDEELKEKAAKEKKRKADEEKRRARLAEEKAKVQKQEESRIEELTPEEAAALKAGGAAASSAPAPAPAADAAKASGEGGEGEGEEEKGAQPINNGGICPNYTWTQNLQDLQVLVSVPAGTKAKMLTVEILKKKLKVGVKGQEAIVDGELHAGVKMEECFWSVEDNPKAGDRLVSITLQKINQMEWWKCVLVGDPEINTQKARAQFFGAQFLRRAILRRAIRRAFADARALSASLSGRARELEALRPRRRDAHDRREDDVRPAPEGGGAPDRRRAGEAGHAQEVYGAAPRDGLLEGEDQLRRSVRSCELY